MSTPLIKLDSVYKTYMMGDEELNALNNVSLTIEKGEYTAILGPSGSGKSTLMNILGCLDVPSKGSYCLDGQEVSQMSRNELALIRNKKIGFVFQSFNLLDFSTALENVELPLVYRGTGAAERTRLATEMLEKVGLGERIHHKPQELSGGQRQRVAVARALVTDPDVVLADEPTGNLDSKSGEAVVNLFKDMSSKGKTILIVTHDKKVADQMNRTINIVDGQVTQQATVV